MAFHKEENKKYKAFYLLRILVIFTSGLLSIFLTFYSRIQVANGAGTYVSRTVAYHEAITFLAEAN